MASLCLAKSFHAQGKMHGQVQSRGGVSLAGRGGTCLPWERKASSSMDPADHCSNSLCHHRQPGPNSFGVSSNNNKSCGAACLCARELSHLGRGDTQLTPYVMQKLCA